MEIRSVDHRKRGALLLGLFSVLYETDASVIDEDASDVHSVRDCFGGGRKNHQGDTESTVKDNYTESFYQGISSTIPPRFVRAERQ